MKPLSTFDNQLLDKHFATQGTDMSCTLRVLQWNPGEKEGRALYDRRCYTCFNHKTLRIHAHKDDKRKTGYPDLYWESSHGVAKTLIGARSIKFWDLRRHASSRELARLQGFPDDYILPKHKAAHLFGNAVTVPVAHAAIEAAFKHQSPPETLLDLCSGIGGFHVAARQLYPDIECVGFSEIKGAAVDCYTQNFPEATAMGDLRRMVESGDATPKADLLCAGFPCQSFSGPSATTLWRNMS